MRQQSEAHRQARLLSTFQTLVARAEDDILADLRHPRRVALTVNDDRPARWTAVQRLIANGAVVVMVPERMAKTRREPPGGGPRRERLEVRVRLPDPSDIYGRQGDEGENDERI